MLHNALALQKKQAEIAENKLKKEIAKLRVTGRNQGDRATATPSRGSQKAKESQDEDVASPVKKVKAATNVVKAVNSFKVPAVGQPSGLKIKPVKVTSIKASNVRYTEEQKQKMANSSNATPVKRGAS
jgi:hypothetical protein